MADKEHPIHKWISTTSVLIATGAFVLGGVISWAIGWATFGHRISTLETEVARQKVALERLKPAPTAKEQLCAKLLEDLSSETRTDFSNRRDMRDLVEDAGCLPKRRP